MRGHLLHVLVDGVPAGRLERSGDVLTFTYADAYRDDRGSTPLSLSMPLAGRSFRGSTVKAFCEGLLPDSGAVRERWARQFQTRDNAFDLLAAVGEDCAGGVQFVRPERVDGLDPGSVQWMSDDDIAAWIRVLRSDPASWLPEMAYGQFSLAGAQSKFALLYDGERWGSPTGAVPTTHIVKPAIVGFDDHEVNEHLTLRLAAAVGLPAASSVVTEFAGERAVVVTRYDRILGADGRWRRVHQEDCCQALATMPSAKYEQEGGPGATGIVQLLRNSSTEPGVDVDRFCDALLFNWVVANTDAHAKNFSVLLAGDRVRLAPLYDLASVLPYLPDNPMEHGRPGKLDGRRLRMAMRVGSQAALGRIVAEDWAALGRACGVEGLPERARAMCDRVAEHVGHVADRAGAGLESDMVRRWSEKVGRRATFVAAVLDGRVAMRRPRQGPWGRQGWSETA